MKLDRNTNRGGRGKYALVNMRKMLPLIEGEKAFDPEGVPKETVDIYNAFHLLHSKGIITLGNETPGDQFFVMKYKDKFTHEALMAYAKAVCMEGGQSLDSDLFEYAEQMVNEAHLAKSLGNRIPD